MKTLVTLCILTITLSCNTVKTGTNGNPAQPTELNGSYSVVSMNSKDMNANSMELVFNASTGEISGSSGCNRLFGSFTQNNGELAFSGFGATKMYCDGRMDLEQEFLQGLQVVNKYAFANGMLELKNNDQVLMTLKVQE